MIPAAPSRWLAALLVRDAERRLRGAFADVRVRGLPALGQALARGPVLVVSNHAAWWDPILLVWLCRGVLRADAYAMMNADNLARAPFFRGVGAFGVTLANAADGARAVRYAAKLLSGPGRLVWIFPQGREVPVSHPELDFRAGAAEVARVARRAEVVVAALRYEFGGGPAPSVYVSFGAAEAGPARRDVGEVRARLVEGVRREQAAIERAVGGAAGIEAADVARAKAAEEGFESLLARREGLMGRLLRAALAALTRPRDLPDRPPLQ